MSSPDGADKAGNDCHKLLTAEFDFRTDSMTLLTQAMFDAAITTTYNDDVTREDTTTENFQAEMAQLTEHEDALFVITATMGNQLAMRALLTEPPYSVLVDARSHILIYEAGGVSSMTGATLIPVEPRNRKYLTLEDIRERAIISDSPQLCPTKIISIENTCNGLVMPVAEIRRISAFARQHGIRMHLDGTRIWDAAASGAGTIPDFTREFDTATLCFSKGVGAPIGSMLVGSKHTISQARRVRQSIGGGLHQMGLLATMARTALKHTFVDGNDGRKSLIARSHGMAMRIAELWLRSGGKLLGPTETCMVFLDIKDSGLTVTELEKLAFEHGLLIKLQRLVIHYQISEEAIDRVEKLFSAIAARNLERKGSEAAHE